MKQNASWAQPLSFQRLARRSQPLGSSSIQVIALGSHLRFHCSKSMGVNSKWRTFPPPCLTRKSPLNANWAYSPSSLSQNRVNSPLLPSNSVYMLSKMVRNQLVSVRWSHLVFWILRVQSLVQSHHLCLRIHKMPMQGPRVMTKSLSIAMDYLSGPLLITKPEMQSTNARSKKHPLAKSSMKTRKSHMVSTTWKWKRRVTIHSTRTTWLSCSAWASWISILT